jgi:hypothetical protein
MAYKEKWQGNNGIMNYIQKEHPDLIPKSFNPSQAFAFINKLQRRFLISIKVKYTRNKEHYKIQKNWNEFKIFLENE